MAHFAEIDDSALVEGGYEVLRIVVVGDADTCNDSGEEDESVGAAFLTDLLPGSGPWIQVSYTTHYGKRAGDEPGFRGNYPGTACLWRPDLNGDEGAFIPRKPYPSWILNTTTWVYDAPVAHPVDGLGPSYEWDEDGQEWVHNPPHPSWTFNAETLAYDPPKPHPDDGRAYDWNEATGNWNLA